MSVSHVVATCYGEASHVAGDGTVCASDAHVLRIKVETDKDGSVVRMAGRLAGEFLEEAERVCLSAEPPLEVDASGLLSADADGLVLLVKILDGGARVEGLSQYLAMRVRSLRVGAGD